MSQIINLRDLLKHEILDLYSAEEQIIEALPKMIDKAGNAELKKALSDHLKVTEQQKNRLDDIKELMAEEQEDGSEKKKSFFSKLFGGSGGEKCKGTEGLIKEGQKMMGEDMTPEAMDAAIIGAAQKIEHYEISGYGTAVAYARQLGLSNVAGLLRQTRDEEYAADDSLTKLAVSKLNVEAESATPKLSKRRPSKAGKGDASKSSSSASKGESSKARPSSKSGNASKSNGLKSTSKSNSKANTSKNSPSKGSTLKDSKSSGNKSAGKLVSKAAGKSNGKSTSKSSSQSGKGKSLRQR